MIGRNKEINILNKLYNSNESQFVAVYGRRRIGKTYLINELFQDRITFKHSGLSPIENSDSSYKSPLKYQLKNFYNSLILCGMEPKKCPTDWMEAFLMLELFLQKIDDGKRQLIFIDELPWLDTPKSGFITAFESFWNNWACSRKNIMLVVCGSATSWMSDKLINNHGGLYNRITYEIKLEPFTLKECEQYFLNRNIKFSNPYAIALFEVGYQSTRGHLWKPPLRFWRRPPQSNYPPSSVRALRVRPQTAKGPYFKDGSTNAGAPAS